MDSRKCIVLASIAIAMAVFSCGCASIFGDNRNITEISIYGQDYKFGVNIIDSLKIPINDQPEIKSLFDSSSSACVLFNGSSETDNSYFAVVGYNVIWKLQAYYTGFGEAKQFYVCNETNITADAVIEFRGPNTGATGNSVQLSGNHIIVQGRSPEELEKAGDKFVLSVFGITEI